MPTNTDELLFPVADWSIGPILDYQCVTVKLGYLSSPMQPLDEAQQSQRFALTPAQAVEIATALLRTVQTLDTLGAQGAPTDEPLQ